jgi:hypothetical protein
LLTLNFKRRSCHTLSDTDLCPTTNDICSTVHYVSSNSFLRPVRVRTEHPVQPLLYLSISKRYQLSSTDPPVSTVG